MLSMYSALFTLLLFSELSSHLVTVAMPATKFEDGTTDQDGLGSFLGDDSMTEHAAVSPESRRSFMLDDIRDDDGSPKVIIVSDTRLRGQRVRGLNPAFARGFPLTADRSSGTAAGGYSMRVARRNTDIDMLRCMVGRVYRPCWEV